MKTPPKINTYSNPYQQNNNYAMRDKTLEQAIFNCLDNIVEIKLMLFYTSCQHMKDYRPAEKTIRDYINISHDRYVRGRNALQERNWITIDEGLLTINYDVIYDDYFQKVLW